MMLEIFKVTEENWHDACILTPSFGITESPAYIGRGIAALVADPNVSRFSGSILTSRQLSDLYGVTDVDGSRPDCWGLIAANGMDGADAEVIRKFR